MRLLHVICSTDAESGGPLEAILRISEVLVRQGDQVQIVSLESPDEVAARMFPFPIKGVGRGIGKFRFNLSLTRWVEQNSRNFDVVILHGLWNFSSLGAWLALRKLPNPYYVFAHGMMDPWFRKSNPIKHSLKQVYWDLFEGRVLRDAQGVLFTCEEERVRAQGVFKGHKYRERVVCLGTRDPCGDSKTEIQAFRSQFPSLRDKRFVLFLSRIHRKKGCDILIQAFADCLGQLPADLDLVMAGPDVSGWVAELKVMAEALGVAARIHWTGMLKGATKWGAFRSAEALVIPSHQENFGFVVAEAMACSTPVLISDKVNIWREVQMSNAGIVERDTVEGTRKLLTNFCALSAEEKEGMRMGARAGFLKHFNIEETAREFKRVVMDKAPKTSESGVTA